LADNIDRLNETASSIPNFNDSPYLGGQRSREHKNSAQDAEQYSDGNNNKTLAPQKNKQSHGIGLAGNPSRREQCCHEFVRLTVDLLERDDRPLTNEIAQSLSGLQAVWSRRAFCADRTLSSAATIKKFPTIRLIYMGIGRPLRWCAG
jgi:hypothetical protein